MHTEADMEDFTVQEVSEKKNNRWVRKKNTE